MADIQWSDVADLQANLTAVPAGAQNKILAYVNGELNPEAFGGVDSARYVLARCYLAAHLGELARRNGSASIVSKTIGTNAITLSFAKALTGSGLDETPWGMQYAELLIASPLRIGAGLCR